MNKPIRILLIDGFAVMRNALRALITTEPDMDVIGDAADGASAIEQAILLHPDVVILDLSSLGSDSMIILSSLTEILPRARILVLTDEIDQSEISAVIGAGVKGYLVKGTGAPEILQAIRKLHRGEEILDPAVANILS
jgi:DNA-binding NarL/FixJ family response regulator